MTGNILQIRGSDFHSLTEYWGLTFHRRERHLQTSYLCELVKSRVIFRAQKPVW